MTTTNNPTEQDLIAHLQGLQETLTELRKERRIRSAVGVGGFLVIMGAVLAFAANLHSYATQYPADRLTRALGAEAENLLGAPETLALGETLRQEAVQTLVPAVSRQVQNDLPRFHQEIQAMFADVETYLNTTISQRATRQLAKVAESIHAELLKEYGHLPVQGIQQATAAAQAEYLKQLRAVLLAHLQQAAGGIGGLQASLQQLTQDPDYVALQQATPEQLERNFYIAVLELAAHNLKQTPVDVPLADRQATVSLPAKPEGA
ncbi:MAG: hypothetical protein Kow0065_03850 [Methylomicrobium sp.]